MLKFKKLHPDAKTPRYATEGAACFDVSALEEGEVRGHWTFRTGLAFEVPEGHVMLVYSRSGHGFNADIRLANSVGCLDSDYRGELFVKLRADSDKSFFVARGDRIAQCMVIPCHQWELIETDELSTTVRGKNGLGSTGVK